MSKSKKHETLIDVLKTQQDRSFSVVSIRDQMVDTFYQEKDVDLVSLRKWVYGKFSTLLKQGCLHEQQLSSSKKRSFSLTVKFIETYMEDINTGELEKENFNRGGNNDTDQALKLLAKEYRLQLNVQLGELEEYQRLAGEHPSLRPQLNKKTLLLSEENSRMLGRLKAIETLIIPSGSV